MKSTKVCHSNNYVGIYGWTIGEANGYIGNALIDFGKSHMLKSPIIPRIYSKYSLGQQIMWTQTYRPVSVYCSAHVLVEIVDYLDYKLDQYRKKKHIF